MQSMFSSIWECVSYRVQSDFNPYRTDAVFVVLVRLPFLGCKAKVVAGFKIGAPLQDLHGFVIFFSTLYIQLEL